MLQLVVQNEDGGSVIHELTGTVMTLGRHPDNTIVLNEGTVSTHHAELLCSDGSILLRDLKSANGTTINNAPVHEVVLKHGDEIMFGSLRTTFLSSLQTFKPNNNLLHQSATPNSKRRVSVRAGLFVLLITIIASIVIYTKYEGKTVASQQVNRVNDNPTPNTISTPRLEATSDDSTRKLKQVPTSTPVVEVFQPKTLRRTEIAYDFVAHVDRGGDGNYNFRLALEPSSTTSEAINNGFLARGWNGKAWTFTIPSGEIQNAQHVLNQIHFRSSYHTPDTEMGTFATTIGKVSFVGNKDFVYSDGTKLYDGFDDLTMMFEDLLEGISL